MSDEEREAARTAVEITSYEARDLVAAHGGHVLAMKTSEALDLRARAFAAGERHGIERSAKVCDIYTHSMAWHAARKIRTLLGTPPDPVEPSVLVSKLRATVAYWRKRLPEPGFVFKQMAHDIERDCDEAENGEGTTE